MTKKNDCSDLKDKIKQLEENNKKQKEECSKLLNKHLEKINQLEEELKEKEEFQKEINKNTINIVNKNEKLEEENKQLKKEIDKLSANLKKSEKEIQKLKDKYEGCNNRCKKCQETEDENNNLKTLLKEEKLKTESLQKNFMLYSKNIIYCKCLLKI